MDSPSTYIFLRLCLPFMAGIYGFYELNDYIIYQLLKVVLFFSGTTLVLLNILYRKLSLYRYKLWVGCVWIFFFFIFGAWLCAKNNLQFSRDFFKSSDSLFKIRIDDEPQLKSGIIRFTANIVASSYNQSIAPATGKLLVSVKTDESTETVFYYGDELWIQANITRIKPPQNPGEFDYQAWLATKNTYHQVFLKKGNFIKTGKNNGNKLISYALKLREKQVQYFKEKIKNPEAMSVASTLILGYRSDLDAETLAAYSKTGTIHALSVSGMHVGIIYMILNWVFGFLNNKTPFKILKLVSSIPLIWFYALLTGFSPPALRSALMLTFFILGKNFNQHINSYNILSFTAFILLCYDPYLLFDVGFQLSYLAVAGLIYLQPKIYKSLYIKQKWIDQLWASIALSLAAQIATFPLSIYYFHQFPTYFILSNLFIILPVALIMYMGLGMLILKAGFIAAPFEWLICFMNKGLKYISELPFAIVEQIWLNKFQFICLSLSLLTITIAFSIRHKNILWISLCFLLSYEISSAYTCLSKLYQHKTISFRTNKTYTVALIKGRKVWLLSPETTREKSFRYFIQPGLDQLGVKHIYRLNPIDTLQKIK